MASQYVDLPLTGGGGGVTSINTLTGDITLAAGSGITITPAGNTLTIATTGTLSNTLTNSHIFVGNASNVATDVAVSGDLTLVSTGAFTVASVGGKTAAQVATTVTNNTADVTLGATATSGGLTLVGQVLSAAQASASQNGWLSSTDWTNFSTTVQQSKTIKNTSGGTITKGQAVYITGYDVGAGADTVSLAKADSTATMPSIGIVTSASIANNATGSIQIAGDATGIDTSALTVGQVAYVSPTTAGALTTTYPLISGGPPPVAQMVGIVTRSDATVGAIYVVAQQPDQLQNGTKANSFYIGDGTAGAKTVNFNAGATSVGTLSWTPTANRSILLPNLSGTVALTNAAQTFTGLQNFSDGTSGIAIRNTGDTTKQIEFDASGNTTGVIGTLKTAFTTAKVVTFPDTTTVLGGLGTAQSWSSTNNFLDGTNLSIFIRNTADTTKRLVFSLGGSTTSIDTTLATSSTSARTITLPDATTTLIGTANTATVSNKRFISRTGTVASSATPTINTDNVDYFSVTALAAAITSMTTNLSGTPNAADTLWVSFKDNGTARAITWGAGFASTTVALPTNTVISTELNVLLGRNQANNLWLCLAVA